MKKIILLICLLLFACQSGFAGTASVFNNIDADNLRDQIIKLYTLEGAHVDNYVTNANSFSISKNQVSSMYNARVVYDYTIVQDKKNSIVSLTMSYGVGAYPNAAGLSSYEQKELDRIKSKILGTYSYGLGYKEKVYFYNEYNQDGILIQKNVMAGAQRILGFKLTAVKYDAKNKGLYIGDRIKKVNGVKLSKYSRPELARIFKPTSENDEIEITYKRKGNFKNVILKPTFVKTENNL